MKGAVQLNCRFAAFREMIDHLMLYFRGSCKLSILEAALMSILLTESLKTVPLIPLAELRNKKCAVHKMALHYFQKVPPPRELIQSHHHRKVNHKSDELKDEILYVAEI